jgi:hypothetical protein
LATSFDPSLRNGADALLLAQQAERLLGAPNPRILRVLAAAYAELGRFSEATETARRGLELATTRGDNVLAQSLENDIALYDVGRPNHTGSN